MKILEFVITAKEVAGENTVIELKEDLGNDVVKQIAVDLITTIDTFVNIASDPVSALLSLAGIMQKYKQPKEIFALFLDQVADLSATEFEDVIEVVKVAYDIENDEAEEKFERAISLGPEFLRLYEEGKFEFHTLENIIDTDANGFEVAKLYAARAVPIVAFIERVVLQFKKAGSILKDLRNKENVSIA